MEKEFVPYELALELKNLGFDEPCFATWNGETLDMSLQIPSDDFFTKAPTFSQCFKWFREKHGLYHSIGLDNSLENDVNCDYQIINHCQSISEHETNFNNYEKAELACLEKLIEIVKTK